MRDAQIVDLDGTLASMAWRTPLVTGGNHDWDSFLRACTWDAPVPAVLAMVRDWHADTILVSGRSDAVRVRTLAWLADHDVPFTRLHMRRACDLRPDHEVKRDIAAVLLPHFNVLRVVDDRPSVIAMWRSLGLHVVQVVDPALAPLFP